MKIFKFTFWVYFLINILNFSFSNENFYNRGLKFFNEKKYEDARFMFEKSIVFNPKEQADNLRNNGGFVLGYRPGEQTAQHLEHVIYRLTFVGAIYLGLIALIPEFLIARLSVPFYLGGTSLLIVVVVAMDFFSQIQTHLFTSQYEKILSKNKIYKSKWL